MEIIFQYYHQNGEVDFFLRRIRNHLNQLQQIRPPATPVAADAVGAGFVAADLVAPRVQPPAIVSPVESTPIKQPKATGPPQLPASASTCLMESIMTSLASEKDDGFRLRAKLVIGKA